MKRLRAASKFVLCVHSGSVDLEPRKVYQVLPDRTASRDGFVRVVDESGEDYLYPAAYFVPVRLPGPVLRDLERTGLTDGPANTALQPTGGAQPRSRKTPLRAARG
jgi:hypothetical protein